MSATAEAPAASDTHDAIEVDLLIIGAGPAGLYAAYYAGFRGLSTAIVDSLPEPGGQVAAMYPEKLIYDIGGFPAIKGQDFIDNCVEQASQFDPTYLLAHRAEDLERHDDETMTVTTHKGKRVHCKAIVITGGIGTFTPKPLPAAEDFDGKGLVYFVPKLDVMEGKDVLIVGGGDSAFDWALNLQGIAASVTLIHRRDRFRAHEHTVQQVMDSEARVLTFTEVAKIIGDEEVTAVEVFNNQTDERETLKVQAVIAALGFKADIGPLKRWGLEQDKRSLLVDTDMATNLPRIFAAGDITDYPGKVKLISVGFGEAATAVNNAAIAINPEAKLFPGHSSNK
ncbi:MAG TPA: NAD(P)/FAD-dependent oxidoreductase [Egibacteraceae bacterium]|nr:NAD(P)/FAD-dependent oxidoreductase [Egibacteraceae bacterium]